jgi:integrase/recombinase XerD
LSGVKAPNGRLKDKVRINGAIEVHPEGSYYIEWREGGRRRREKAERE